MSIRKEALQKMGALPLASEPRVYPDVPAAYKALSDFAVTHGDRSSDLADFPPSMARQEFAEECDINVIMAAYERTGVISHVADREPLYLDLTAVPDLREALDYVRVADEAFMRLPAKVRREFDNDASAFVDFAQKAENLDQMREWGLAPPKAPEPSPAPAVTPPASPPVVPPAAPPAAPAAS